VFGLLGPNGAGKTTALSMMCGALTPTGGGVDLLGMNVHKNLAKVRVAACVWR
jgi:ABC-2 type transport system ATP-binding protein